MQQECHFSASMCMGVCESVFLLSLPVFLPPVCPFSSPLSVCLCVCVCTVANEVEVGAILQSLLWLLNSMTGGHTASFTV